MCVLIPAPAGSVHSQPTEGAGKGKLGSIGGSRASSTSGKRLGIRGWRLLASVSATQERRAPPLPLPKTAPPLQTGCPAQAPFLGRHPQVSMQVFLQLPPADRCVGCVLRPAFTKDCLVVSLAPVPSPARQVLESSL